MVVVESSEGAGPCNLAELSTGRLDQIRSIVPELDKKCSTTLSRAGCRGQSLSWTMQKGWRLQWRCARKCL